MSIAYEVQSSIQAWANAYQAGYRIVKAKTGLQYFRAVSYWERIEQAGKFGIFPDDQSIDVDPFDESLAGISPDDPGLLRFLKQRPPQPYKKFFWHLLTLDHEAMPIKVHALQSGIDLQIVGVNGGNVLLYAGKCKVPDILPRLAKMPPILKHIVPISIKG